MEGEKKNNSTVIVSVIVVILAVIAYGGYKYMNRGSSAVVAPIDDTQATSTEPTDTPVSSIYKDGTYSVVGNYTSPGGAEQLGVTVTLQNGVITDATAVSKAFRPESIHYQGLFVANFKQYVVGKNIDDVMLSKVSGSSLAPKGFNDALAQIKVQAQA